MVTLSIRSDEEFVLPRAVVVGKIGRLPLKRTDGMPLFEMEKETRVRGGVTYEYKPAFCPKNLYIRLFLQDDKALRALPPAARFGYEDYVGAALKVKEGPWDAVPNPAKGSGTL